MGDPLTLAPRAVWRVPKRLFGQRFHFWGGKTEDPDTHALPYLHRLTPETMHPAWSVWDTSFFQELRASVGSELRSQVEIEKPRGHKMGIDVMLMTVCGLRVSAFRHVEFSRSRWRRCRSRPNGVAKKV